VHRALLDQVRETIHEFAMIRAGDAVAVACSGGADSTALLLVLYELAEPLGCVLSVAHMNHCLRGGESDGDEEFVRGLAERLGMPFHRSRRDVGKLARESKKNQEAAARESRLEFFASLMREGKATRVATAHTADDQAETVLQRLIRGTGTRGLAGIRPVVENLSNAGALVRPTLIRPMLDVRRDDVRDWLRDHGQSWREDSSNQDRRFTRNRIRHELLPQLAQLNPNIVGTLSRTAAIAREEEAFWDDYVRPLCEAWVEWTGDGAVVNLANLAKAPRAVAYRVLRQTLGRLTRGRGGERYAAEDARGTVPGDFLHTEQMLAWALRGQSGQSFPLPNQMEARKEFSHLILRRRVDGSGPSSASRAVYRYAVEVPCTVEVPQIARSFRLELVDLRGGETRYNELGSVLLDATLAEFPLLLRNWQAGDAYQPGGHRSPKKLQDLFQRKRVPRRERDGWPVLVSGGRIVWVRGLAVAQEFCPAPQSAHAIEVRELG
jgi:tRNA(Ile)-lysidine synthase